MFKRRYTSKGFLGVKGGKLIRQKSRQETLLGGRSVPYTLIRTSRAKRLSIKIGEKSGLEVIVPHRTTLRNVPEFLKEKEEWILKHLQEIELQRARKQRIEDGSTIQILGILKKVRIHKTRKSKPHVKEARALRFDQATDTAYYADPEILIYANSPRDARAALENHLRKQAKKHFTERTAQIATSMNANRLISQPITFNRIAIKGQKTRWGSCSRQKNLNFNWRLLFTTPEIVDSIIIHELAHTVHLNHSKKFYALVETHCPNHRQLNRNLKDLSSTFPL